MSEEKTNTLGYHRKMCASIFSEDSRYDPRRGSDWNLLPYIVAMRRKLMKITIDYSLIAEKTSNAQGEKCAACGRLLPMEDPNNAFTQDDKWQKDLGGFLCGEQYKVVCASVEARIAKAARTGR